MQNVEVHAGSPGYLNLMTTQERLATLLVRVSYPGDLVSLSRGRLQDFDRKMRRDDALPVSCTTRNLSSRYTRCLKENLASAAPR
jgi:hypothetical protein